MDKKITITTGINPQEYSGMCLKDMMSLDDCVEFLETKLHPGGLKCPDCGSSRRGKHGWTPSGVQRWRCGYCGTSYTLLTETPFWGTKLGPKEIILLCWMAGQNFKNQAIAAATGLSVDVVRTNLAKIRIYGGS